MDAIIKYGRRITSKNEIRTITTRSVIDLEFWCISTSHVTTNTTFTIDSNSRDIITTISIVVATIIVAIAVILKSY